jgi:hypothetical protein
VAPAQDLALDRGECYGAQLNNGISLCQGEEFSIKTGVLCRSGKQLQRVRNLLYRVTDQDRILGIKLKNIYLSIAYENLTSSCEELQVKTSIARQVAPLGVLGGHANH